MPKKHADIPKAMANSVAVVHSATRILAFSCKSFLPYYGLRNHASGRNRRPILVLVNASMLKEVANTRIPTSDGRELLAFVATPEESSSSQRNLPVLLLIHEFFGLSPEICGKAEAIAEEVGCMVICPDTYRGESTRFIPKAIFLALTTPQDRVNKDLDEVLAWAATSPQADATKVAVAGFCYGGGKALRYAIHYRKAKAVIVIYGKPVLDAAMLSSIDGEVLGIFGERDSQFPVKLVNQFTEALRTAGVRNKILIIEGQGHAFWKDMNQVRNGEKPSTQAWLELTGFLKRTLCIS